MPHAIDALRKAQARARGVNAAAATARRGKAAEKSLSRLAERRETTTQEASTAQLSARLARSERDVVAARGLAQKLVDRLAATSAAKASVQQERDVMQQRRVAVEQRFNVKQQELMIRLAA